MITSLETGTLLCHLLSIYTVLDRQARPEEAMAALMLGLVLLPPWAYIFRHWHSTGMSHWAVAVAFGIGTWQGSYLSRT